MAKFQNVTEAVFKDHVKMLQSYYPLDVDYFMGQLIFNDPDLMWPNGIYAKCDVDELTREPSNFQVRVVETDA